MKVAFDVSLMAHFETMPSPNHNKSEGHYISPALMQKEGPNRPPNSCPNSSKQPSKAPGAFIFCMSPRDKKMPAPPNAILPKCAFAFRDSLEAPIRCGSSGLYFDRIRFSESNDKKYVSSSLLFASDLKRVSQILSELGIHVFLTDASTNQSVR